MEEEKRLYVAYGSNLNLYQMKFRCPTARLIGTGIVKDHELQFKGRSNSAFATIAPKDGSSVPVAVWELQPKDEKALDRYEGYPSYYFKQEIPVEMKNSTTINGMVYIMNLRQNFGVPSDSYVHTVSEGYRNCRLDMSVLKDAIRQSVFRYADTISDRIINTIGYDQQISLFDFDNADVDIDEDISETDEDEYFDFFGEDDSEDSEDVDEDKDEDEDESNPFVPTQ